MFEKRIRYKIFGESGKVSSVNVVRYLESKRSTVAVGSFP